MINATAILAALFRIHGAAARALLRGGRALHPLNMTVDVTYRCNLRCNFCEFLEVIDGRKSTSGPLKELAIDDIKKLIDQLRPRRLITLTGGETLMRKDFPEIIRYACRRHRANVISNGVLIDERIAQLYADLAPRRIWQNGLVLVGISMEGDEQHHDRIVQIPGSWRRTVEGVARLVRRRRETRKAFPLLNLMLVVNGDTVSGLVDFMHLARDLGVDMVNFIAEHDIVPHAGVLTDKPDPARLHVAQRKPEGVDPAFLRRQLIRCFELEQALGLRVRLTPPQLPVDEFVRHYSADRRLDAKEYVCGSAWSRLSITGDGRFAPGCPYLLIGNTRALTLAEAWNGEELRAFRRNIQRDHVYAGCNGCCNLRYTGNKKYGLAGLEAS
jgi:MoaA/NifB/PqqE/SkfB family radical SAM enzyme